MRKPLLPGSIWAGFPRNFRPPWGIVAICFGFRRSRATEDCENSLSLLFRRRIELLSQSADLRSFRIFTREIPVLASRHSDLIPCRESVPEFSLFIFVCSANSFWNSWRASGQSAPVDRGVSSTLARFSFRYAVPVSVIPVEFLGAL